MVSIIHHIIDINSLDLTRRSIGRVQELNEKAPANIVLTLVGNKVDLENRAVKKEEA